MYNLRPVNTNVNTKRVVKNDVDSSSFNDHSDSSNSSSSGLQRNSNLASGSLVSVKKNDALRYQNSSPEPSGSDNMPQLLKHSSNPDMPRIKYYGSLRNNSNFSKMSSGTTTVTSVMNNSSANNTSNSSNGPMTRLRRSANEAQNSAHVLNLQQKKPSFVIESKKVSISNSSALTQRNSNGNNSSNQSSTMIDLSSDEENEQKYKDKVTSPPCKKPKADSPDVASQFGIPILDFNHDETIRKCSQHGITAFIPLKALNSNEPSELCLPLIQVKDFERKRFLFSTNRFLRIGSIKSVNK